MKANYRWALLVPAVLLIVGLVHSQESPRGADRTKPVAAVNGIGGVFIYANDAKALSDWYARHFGLEFSSLAGC